MKHVFVYLMGNEKFNCFKIGISDSPSYRLRQLNFPFDLKLMEVFSTKSRHHARSIESKLHQKHSSQRLRGEWFSGDVAEMKQSFLLECVECALISSENRLRFLELKRAKELTTNLDTHARWSTEHAECRRLEKLFDELRICAVVRAYFAEPENVRVHVSLTDYAHAMARVTL